MKRQTWSVSFLLIGLLTSFYVYSKTENSNKISNAMTLFGSSGTAPVTITGTVGHFINCNNITNCPIIGTMYNGTTCGDGIGQSFNIGGRVGAITFSVGDTWWLNQPWFHSWWSSRVPTPGAGTYYYEILINSTTSSCVTVNCDASFNCAFTSTATLNIG